MSLFDAKALGIAVALGALSACSSDETLPFGGASTTTGTTTTGTTSTIHVCTPGASSSCACTSGATGAQICKADGSGYGACTCEGGGGAGGSGGAGGGSTGGGGSGGGCEPGSTAGCYSGPPGTEGVGLCVAGTETCALDGSGFGPCIGEITPAAEVCATAGDDDCDGQTNEEGADCACVPGSQQACYSGPPSTENAGICHGGTQQCNGSGTGYGPCVGEVVPALETCLTPEDDDCDGSVNEEGAGCVCAPDVSASCYSGPNGTENVGVCKPGVHQCNGQGTAWGPCSGEITPSTDLCATVADEDCNGSPVPCTPMSLWSKHYGVPAQYVSAASVAVDPAGDVVALLENAAGYDFGDGPQYGATLVKLNGSGALQWAKGFSGTTGYSLAVDGAGNIALGCTFGPGTPVDLGGGVLGPPVNQATAACVGKFDASGNHLWSTSFGGTGAGYTVTPWAVRFDAGGNLVIGGQFNYQLQLGATTLTAAGSSGDGFVAKLSPAGAFQWARQAGSSNGGWISGVAIDASSAVVVAGWGSGSVTLGGPAVPTAGGSSDLFVGKLDAAGSRLWAKVFGDASAQYGYLFDAIGPSGDVYVAAPVQGSVDFGGGPLVGSGASGGDIGLVKLDTAGNHQWSKAFGNAQPQTAYSVACDGSGNVFLAGAFQQVVSFAGSFVQSQGQDDAFIAKFSPAGAGLGAAAFGGASPEVARGVAIGPGGDRFLVGAFYATIDLGAGPMTAIGTSDAFVAAIGP